MEICQKLGIVVQFSAPAQKRFHRFRRELVQEFNLEELKEGLLRVGHVTEIGRRGGHQDKPVLLVEYSPQETDLGVLLDLAVEKPVEIGPLATCGQAPKIS